MQETASFVVSFSDPQGAGTRRTLRQAAMYKFEKKRRIRRPDPPVRPAGQPKTTRGS